MFFPDFRKNTIEGYVIVQHGTLNWDASDLHFHQGRKSFNPKPPRQITMVGHGPRRARLKENETLNYRILIPRKKINIRKPFTFYYRTPISGQKMTLRENLRRKGKALFQTRKKRRPRPAQRKTAPRQNTRKQANLSFSDLIPKNPGSSDILTPKQEKFLNSLTGGYKFGMSTEEADSVRVNDQLRNCKDSQPGSEFCLERDIAFLGERAKLSGLISSKTQTLNNITIEFDRRKENTKDLSNDCLNIQDLLTRKITPLFGQAELDFNRYVKNFIWHLTDKRELRVIALCKTSDSGVILLQYRQVP
ncbi:MAG: hypothetical protein ACE5G9_06835 [Nitrospinales bacterium]